MNSSHATIEALGVDQTATDTIVITAEDGTTKDISIDITGTDPIYGGSGDDLLSGTNLGDVLYGGEGDDQINGGPGDDKLYGQAGNDSLTGGSGAGPPIWGRRY